MTSSLAILCTSQLDKQEELNRISTVMNLKVIICAVLVGCLVGVATARTTHIRDRRQLFEETISGSSSGDGDNENGSGDDGGADFTKDDLDVLVTEIRQMIQENPQLIPNWVQLSFHDCFGPSGCNGCLDRSHSGNRALLGTIDDVVALHQRIGSGLSLADFIALLGIQAAKAGAEAANGSLDLPFSIGRKDCIEMSPDTGLPLGNQTNTVELLKSQFDLTTEEVVALMGAHSLGRARSNNTGFNGPWDLSELKLESGYYLAMSFVNWSPEPVRNDRINSTQWTGTASGRRLMMLHADMILLKDFTTSGEFNEPSCTFQTCPDQVDTSGMVRQFQDQILFHEVFSRAFLKMINKSDEELTALE